MNQIKSGRYQARLQHNGVQKILGTFDTAEEAALAHNERAAELGKVPNVIDPVKLARAQADAEVLAKAVSRHAVTTALTSALNVDYPDAMLTAPHCAMISGRVERIRRAHVPSSAGRREWVPRRGSN